MWPIDNEQNSAHKYSYRKNIDGFSSMQKHESHERRYPWAKVLLSPDTIVPHRVPFTLARRFHQICATILVETIAGEELSVPMHYGILAAIDDFPGIDQRRLAVIAGLDHTNVGQIIDALEVKRLVERRINGADRRARELYATARGREVRRQMRPKLLSGQARALAPLAPKERNLLMDLLTRVVEANETYARPGAGRRPPQKRNRVAGPGGRHEQDVRTVATHLRRGAAAP
jgi:MarR family transcriptional regulator, temperature-dependent positive regulator of motility